MRTILFLCFTAILTLQSFDLQAIAYDDEIEKILLVRNTKKPLRRLKKGQMFRQDEAIVYQVQKSSYFQKGKIIEIGDDFIKIEDKFGKQKTANIKDLKNIRRKYTIKTYLGAFGLSGIFVILMLIVGGINSITNSRSYITNDRLAAFLAITLSLIGSTFGYFWTRNYLTYHLNKKWKAEIISMEK